MSSNPSTYEQSTLSLSLLGKLEQWLMLPHNGFGSKFSLFLIISLSIFRLYFFVKFFLKIFVVFAIFPLCYSFWWGNWSLCISVQATQRVMDWYVMWLSRTTSTVPIEFFGNVFCPRHQLGLTLKLENAKAYPNLWESNFGIDLLFGKAL